MKIDKLNTVISAPPEGVDRSGHRAETFFSAYLAQALDNRSVAAQPVAAAPVMTPLLSPLSCPPVLLDDGLRRQGMRQGQDLLTCLEEYQALLAAPRASLKQMGGSVDKMEEELRRLAPFMDNLPESDPLSQVLQSISSLALVETIKYRRGDYL